MSEWRATFIWLAVTCILVGFIYSAIRSNSFKEFAWHGVKQSLSILAGMCVLGLIIYWLSRNV